MNNNIKNISSAHGWEDRKASQRGSNAWLALTAELYLQK